MSDDIDTSIAPQAPRRGRPPRSAAQEAVLNDPRLAEVPADRQIRTEQRQPMRRRKHRNTADKYHIDPSRIPAGQSYEWKRVTFVGMEDKEHQIDTYENGFRPVPADRHPEVAGVNAKHGERIERAGLVLMERPIELRQEALKEDRDESAAQTNNQLRRLRLTGSDEMDRVVQKASRSFGPGALAVED